MPVKSASKQAGIDGGEILCNILIKIASKSCLELALMIYSGNRDSHHAASVLRISRDALS